MGVKGANVWYSCVDDIQLPVGYEMTVGLLGGNVFGNAGEGSSRILNWDWSCRFSPFGGVDDYW